MSRIKRSQSEIEDVIFVCSNIPHSDSRYQNAYAVMTVLFWLQGIVQTASLMNVIDERKQGVLPS